ncbi:MAG: hypothetical protein KDK40_01850, partial [Chlamydiia bacterium]|nr:hypothetical protein [Chlamydiia bacterium]
MNTYLSALLCLILGTSSFLCAEGKLDVGAVYLHLDVLQSGKVIDELDMKGERFDLTHHICAGFLLKGAFMHTTTGGKFQYGSVGLGYYIPLGDCFVCIPSGGYSYSRLKSKIDLPYGETL